MGTVDVHIDEETAREMSYALIERAKEIDSDESIGYSGIANNLHMIGQRMLEDTRE